MNIQDWKKQMADRSARVLDHYFKEACPCLFPRFVYWVTKEHEKGTDPVQNNLILVCRYLRAADLVAAVDMAESDNGGWTCPTCGSTWLDLCEEKSNLNYAHRFVLHQDLRGGDFVDQAIPSAVLTVAELGGVEEWERFMTGRSEWPNKPLQATRETRAPERRRWASE